MGFQDFTAGAVLTATQMDTVMRQTVMSFATTTARDTALSGVLAEGMQAIDEANDRKSTYSGSAWVRDSWYGQAGRTGCAISRAANQSISTGSLTAITWDTESQDTDGFITVSSSTITVPSGLDGLYAITLRVALAASTNGLVAISAGGVSFEGSYTQPATAPTLTVMAGLAAAGTVTGSVYQASGGALNVTGSLSMYRIGR
jgi:hypothetical protein